MNTPK
ncbi:hypothetical protein Avbf_15512 [Armadillidium vulgare]